jgi:hypothetical protein
MGVGEKTLFKILIASSLGTDLGQTWDRLGIVFVSSFFLQYQKAMLYAIVLV